MDRIIRQGEIFLNQYKRLRNQLRRRIIGIPLIEIVRLVPAFQVQLDDTNGNQAHEPFVRDLVESLERLNVERNGVLINQGEIGTSMFFLRRGTVIVDVNGHPVVTLTAPSFFGEISLFFRNRIRNASVRARGNIEVHELTRTRFRRIARRYPDVRTRVERNVVVRETEYRRRRIDDDGEFDEDNEDDTDEDDM